MPPKRKPTSAASGRPAKRIASERPTPDHSDEEYTESPAMSETETEDIQHLVQKYQPVRTRPKQHQDPASHLFPKCDEFDAKLKPDHKKRPCWVDPQGHIILESFSRSFRDAQNFLINIAEPQSRVSKMHEYTLTPHSLFAAVSVGLTTEDIIHDLDAISKVELPEDIINHIITSTSSFGKARLVLKNTRYFVESTDPNVLQKLLQDPIIGPCRVDTTEGLMKEAAPKQGSLVIPGTKLAAGANASQATNLVENETTEADYLAELRQEDDDEEEEVDQVHSFQIRGEDVQKIAKRAREIELPLTEEYDFHMDMRNANLDIDLKPQAQIRPYQEQALNKMFGNGRARSGIIVLPCGAGKTLVGITAACTVKKSIMVLCTSSMSVVQWRNEFLKWTNINPNDIASFTAETKDKFPGNAGVIISTYSMITQSRNRSYESKKIMDFIQSREWGLLIADEVHVVPAEMFKKVTYSIASHSKLGLTATLLREDDKIEDLNFLIGPKLYEANWQELSAEGHIARVQCAEVWCPMTTEFYTEYLQADSVNKRALLFTMNPTKFQYCQFLIDYHEKRGDKIIVFSDNVYALERYAKQLKKAYIYGGTPQSERLRILENFQHNPEINTIFLSKIGDTSLDLPEATCLIQISSHYGSRRQEAQRLGRILRAKRRNDEGFNAFFYSLVSKDTMEMYYSSKRQAFLVDQGYAFKVITTLKGLESMPNLAFREKQEQHDLLAEVLFTISQKGDDLGSTEKIEDDLFSNGKGKFNRNKKSGVRRFAGSLAELGGGADMAYVEVDVKSKNQQLKKKGAKNDFIRKLQRGTINARKARSEN